MSNHDHIIASDGSRWSIECVCPPIPYRQFDWAAVHDDYDGAPDAHDDRVVYSETEGGLAAAVEEWIADNAEDEPERQPLRFHERFAAIGLGILVFVVGDAMLGQVVGDALLPVMVLEVGGCFALLLLLVASVGFAFEEGTKPL